MLFLYKGFVPVVCGKMAPLDKQELTVTKLVGDGLCVERAADRPNVMWSHGTVFVNTGRGDCSFELNSVFHTH